MNNPITKDSYKNMKKRIEILKKFRFYSENIKNLEKEISKAQSSRAEVVFLYADGTIEFTKLFNDANPKKGFPHISKIIGNCKGVFSYLKNTDVIAEIKKDLRKFEEEIKEKEATLKLWEEENELVNDTQIKEMFNEFKNGEIEFWQLEEFCRRNPLLLKRVFDYANNYDSFATLALLTQWS